MASNLLKAFFGEVRLYLADLDSDVGRSLVVHEPARGDQFEVQDRGLQLRRSSCEVVFCPVPREKDHHLTRYDAFLKLIEGGKPQVFTHPIRGSYRARVGECREMLSDAQEIRLSVEFVQVEPPIQVFNVTAGASPIAGPEAVEVEAAKADQELAAAGLASSVPAAAQSTVEGWTEGEADSRAVYLEAASLSSQIETDIVELELTAQLDRWPIYRQMVILRARVLDAAEASASETARVFDFLVQVATPLRVICARVYGASEAEERARQVRVLNDLRTPGLVPAGVTLKMPVPEARG
jgi:prophage DNA circulation protein